MTEALPVKQKLAVNRGVEVSTDPAWPKYSGGFLYEAKQLFAKALRPVLRQPIADFTSHVASHTEIGSRTLQEDTVLIDVSTDPRCTTCVVSDGMGGHNCGDVASQVAVDTVKKWITDDLTADLTGEELRAGLVWAAESANNAIRERMAHDTKTRGMGCTLLIAVFCADGLFWMSIGDSPLYLYRGGRLHKLNQDHSLAPQIDQMVKVGLLSEEEGAFHPDRNVLTSALTGSEISRIDAHSVAFEIRLGDIFLVASDGLQFLTDAQIEATLTEHRRKPVDQLTQAITDRVMALQAKDQDNIGLALVKVTK